MDERAPGVAFLPQGHPWASSFLWLSFGLFLTLLAVCSARIRKESPWTFVTLGSVGLAILAASLHTLVARLRPSYLGDFALLDPRYAWFVDPHCVTVLDLADLRGSSLTHYLRGGFYQDSSLGLAFPGTSVSVGFNGRRKAESAHAYLCALATVLAWLDPGCRGDSRLVGGVVHHLLETGQLPSEAVAPGPVVPEFVGRPSRVGWDSRLWQYLGLLALSFVVFLLASRVLGP